MKRTMKKNLSLILAVLMLFTSVGFNVVAQGDVVCNHQTDLHNSDFYKVINPTCEDGGYTEYYCINNCGTCVTTGNPTPALGHQYGKDIYVAVDENDLDKGYNKYKECERKFVKIVDGKATTVTCGTKSYDLDENEDKAVYYVVQFVNNKATPIYDETIKYTRVISGFDTEKTEMLDEIYVKKGDAAVCSISGIYHGKDKEYGDYKHIGWTTDGTLEAKADKNLDASDCVDLANYPINENTVFYPVFQGLEVDPYEVIFYGADSKPITNPQKIEHGKFATYRVNGQPTNPLYPNPPKAEDIVNTYEFIGWVTTHDKTDITKTEDIETTPVYGNIYFYPTYKPVPKNYTVEFRDDAKNLISSFDNVHLEENYATGEMAAITPTKASDDTYFYTWKGTWRVLKEDGSYGTEINLSNFKVHSSDIINSNLIRLVPVFERTLIRYAVEITMGIPASEGDDYYKGEAEVQVLDKNGQLVAVGKTDANGKFRCHLNYMPPFTVNVATYEGKYIGSANILTLTKSPNSEEEEATKYNNILVQMELNPEYETHCSCIHHNSLLQPLVVGIFNILYSFFKVKYVCCYDMYSTIGPLLAYTAG